MEFPELKDKAFDMYKEWEPDVCLIEAKAAGAPLVYELRAMGLIVSEYTPTRGTKKIPNDKFARLNSVADIFRSGKVWAPDRRWAREVIEQMASFPNADHDDLVDSTVQAMLRFRAGGLIKLESDENDSSPVQPRRAAYY
jgi:predicted phage terminase large subunit-like protein